MSTKKTKTPPKTPKKPAPKTKPYTPREYGRDDFKKLTPAELEAAGFSRKSERYKDLKTNEIISKRQFTKRYFGLSPEQRAKKIKSGERPILDNAPKKARVGRIIQADKAKQAKQAASKKSPRIYRLIRKAPLAEGRVRYDYRLSPYDVINAIKGNQEAEYNLLAHIQKILKAHTTGSLRFVLSDGIDGYSSELFLNSNVDGLFLVEELKELMNSLLTKGFIGSPGAKGVTKNHLINPASQLFELELRVYAQ